MLHLKVCKRSNEKYQEIRNRHYIPNKGCHGQQLHFLILLKNEIIGIISGSSSAYAVKDRDNFFNIPSDKHKRTKIYLPSIISNNVFRLECHEKNLGTKTLKLWRNVVSFLWEKVYDISVIGFETFIIEEDYRKGAVYKADNWEYVGKTAGSSKTHSGLKNKSERKDVVKKLIYCRWKNMKQVTPTEEYKSCWRQETREEKERAKKLRKIRRKIKGMRFKRGENVKKQYKEQF